MIYSMTTIHFFPNTHLKPVTYKTYNTQLNTWLSLLPVQHRSLSFLYEHPNYAVVTLRTHLETKDQNTPRMVNQYIKAVMAATREDSSIQVNHTAEERWKELRQITYDNAFAYRMEQQPSPGQALKSGAELTHSQLCAIRDALPDGSFQKLLLGCYTHLPPVRADYYATQILPFGQTPTTPNYIFHSPSKTTVVLTDFKTSRLYKEIKNDFPPELHRQLVLSLKAFPRTYLFVNKNGEPFTRNGFTKWATTTLFDATQKGLTLTMLRHIYISAIDFNMPAIELKRIGDKMGHHINQQMLYKWSMSNSDRDE